MRGGGLAPTKSHIPVVFTNIRSLIPKRDAFCAVINDCQPEIIALTETWLSSKIRDSELFYAHKKYRIFRNDRKERIGGGVLIAVDECYEWFC